MVHSSLALVDSRDEHAIAASSYFSKLKTMKPELYFDKRSPPVRSVLLLIEALGLDVQKNAIDLAKGEHLSESYLKVF